MTTCTSNDWLLGPQVHNTCRQFDFTLLFEATFLSAVPSAIFLICLLARLWHLSGRSAKAHGGIVVILKMACSCTICRSIGNSNNSCTQISLGLLMVLHIIFLVLIATTSALRHPASLAAGALAIAGTGVAIIVSLYEHTRSVAPSSILQTYFLMVILLDMARTRTLWLIGNSSSAIILSLTLGCEILTFSLESVWKTNYLTIDTSAEEQSGLWERALFSWLLSTFLRGYSGTLSLICLPIIDSKLDSRVLHRKLVEIWCQSKTFEHFQRSSNLTCIRATGQEERFAFGYSALLLATIRYCIRPTALLGGLQVCTTLPDQCDHQMG